MRVKALWRRRVFRPGYAFAAVSTLATATPAAAAEDYFEFWLNPSIATEIATGTEIELETAQRFRSRDDGGRDTYFFRLWVNRRIGNGLTLSGAVEQRWNDSRQEQRLHQQLSFRTGAFRSRSRLEQRFVDGEDRMGLRFRQRVGFEGPIDTAGKWNAGANAEGFFTLRAGNRSGDTGLTGLRTTVEVGHEVSDRLSLSLGYMRAQEIREGREDRVGHGPLIGIELSL